MYSQSRMYQVCNCRESDWRAWDDLTVFSYRGAPLRATVLLLWSCRSGAEAQQQKALISLSVVSSRKTGTSYLCWQSVGVGGGQQSDERVRGTAHGCDCGGRVRSLCRCGYCSCRPQVEEWGHQETHAGGEHTEVLQAGTVVISCLVIPRTYC